MQARISTIGSTRFLFAHDGDMFDALALEVYGRTAGVTEALMAANFELLRTHTGRLSEGDAVRLPSVEALGAQAGRQVGARAPVRLFS